MTASTAAKFPRAATPLSVSGGKQASGQPRVSKALGVVAQVRRACAPGNRLAAVVGLLLGGFVPLAVFVIAHLEAVPFTRVTGATCGPWVLVFGGLAFSAKTVFEWARAAFASTVKAGGFVLLAEGVMVTAQTPWLSLAALGYLIAINATATACTLAGQK